MSVTDFTCQLDYADLRTRLPDLVGLFAVPAPAKDVVPRSKAFRDENTIHNLCKSEAWLESHTDGMAMSTVATSPKEKLSDWIKPPKGSDMPFPKAVLKVVSKHMKHEPKS